MQNNELTTYIGLDPGKQGGITVIDCRGVWTFAMPVGTPELWSIIKDASIAVAPHACVEKIPTAFPKVTKSAMSTLYGNYRELRAMLVAAQIPFDDVPPKTWQRAFAISPRKKKEPDRTWKKRLAAKARELFPSLDVWSGTIKGQLAVGDSILIAEYCRRLHEGGLTK